MVLKSGGPILVDHVTTAIIIDHLVHNFQLEIPVQILSYCLSRENDQYGSSFMYDSKNHEIRRLQIDQLTVQARQELSLDSIKIRNCLSNKCDVLVFHFVIHRKSQNAIAHIVGDR